MEETNAISKTIFTDQRHLVDGGPHLPERSGDSDDSACEKDMKSNLALSLEAAVSEPGAIPAFHRRSPELNTAICSRMKLGSNAVGLDESFVVRGSAVF